MKFLSLFSQRREASPPASSACLLREARIAQTATQERTWSCLVSVEGPLVILPFKKYVLKKLYWKGGWQELVGFSFQYIGTDWKGNLLNKNLKNIYPLEVMRIYLLNTWEFFLSTILSPSQVYVSQPGQKLLILSSILSSLMVSGSRFRIMII